jgi:hypothetical protein
MAEIEGSGRQYNSRSAIGLNLEQQITGGRSGH